MSKQSNHPNHIKKQIPKMINQRINSLSKTETNFNYAKKDYEDALHQSHYDVTLEYIKSPKNATNDPHMKKRRRKLIYFQPPFSNRLKTPIGKLFFRLIRKHFRKNHQLYKILNHRCLKLSYCCMHNIKTEITSHNKKILSNNQDKPNIALCNCRSGDCPMNGECLKENLIYQAEIHGNDNNSKTYIGSTGNSFKERYRGRKSSFKNEKKRFATELSKYYWSLIDKGETPRIVWSIIKEVRSRRSGRNGCNLCNTERYLIARADKEKTLNRRNELKRSCPHYSNNFF